jgi:hypothetical protein
VPAAVALPSASASSTPPAPPPAPAADTTLPHGAALLASVDLGKLAGPELLLALRTFDRSIVEALESALGLPPGGLGPGWLAAVGVDATRPIAVAEIGVAPEDLRALARLRALVPEKDPQGKASPGAFDAVRGVADKLGPFFQGRILLPAVDAPRVKKAIGALLLKAGLAGDGPDAYGNHHFRIELGGDAATVVLDFAAGHGSTEALVALHARPAGAPHDDPPRSKAAPRATYSPTAMRTSASWRGW